jgi:hypothetical protein
MSRGWRKDIRFTRHWRSPPGFALECPDRRAAAGLAWTAKGRGRCGIRLIGPPPRRGWSRWGSDRLGPGRRRLAPSREDRARICYLGRFPRRWPPPCGQRQWPSCARRPEGEEPTRRISLPHGWGRFVVDAGRSRLIVRGGRWDAHCLVAPRPLPPPGTPRDARRQCLVGLADRPDRSPRGRGGDPRRCTVSP